MEELSKTSFVKVIEHSFEEMLKENIEEFSRIDLEELFKEKLLKFFKTDLGKVVEHSIEEFSRIDFEEWFKEKLLKFSRIDLGKVEKENIEESSRIDLGKVVEMGEVVEMGVGTGISLTQTGFIAAQIKEVHCLVFANIYTEMTAYSSKELIQLFSCFTNITVADEFKTLTYKNLSNKRIVDVLETVCTEYEKYEDFEGASRVETGMDNTLHYDLIHLIAEWFDAESAVECKHVLQKVEAEKGIFLGEFVKAILKINTISAELENIAESLGHVEFLRTLKEIPAKTLKFVATSQSLYV